MTMVVFLLAGCGDKSVQPSVSPDKGTEIETVSQEDKQEVTSKEDVNESISEEEEPTSSEEESTAEVEESTTSEEEATKETENEATQDVVDVSKLVKKKIQYDEEGTAAYTYIYTYDENGLLLKEEHIDIYNWEGQPQITEYTYDADGKLAQTVFYVSDGGYYFQKEIKTYNSDGNVTREEYESEGLKKTTDYLYDASGNLAEMNIDMDDTTIKYAYEYDSYGNLLSNRTWYSGEESIAYSYKYEYYEDGTVKRKESYSGETLSFVEEYYENGVCRAAENISHGACTGREEFDENGNRTLTVEYVHRYDEWVPDSRYQYTYSEADNTVTTTKCDVDGNVVYTEVKMLNTDIPEYDENGVKVSMKSYFGTVDGYGSDFYYLYTYEYDEIGNMVKETCYNYYMDYNGALEKWTEYSY